MKTEIVPLLVGFAFCVGALSVRPMLERFNRPAIFLGGWGESFFGALRLVIIPGSISLVVWSFIHVTWYVAAGLLVGGAVAGSFACRTFPLPFMTALGPILSGAIIIVLHRLTWF